MAKICQGILGGFSGTVGTVVGGTWNGVDYMRSRSTSMRNPRTEAQILQRERFALAASFVRSLSGYVKVGYRSQAVRQTSLNASMSHVCRDCVVESGGNLSLDFARFRASVGPLTPVSASVSAQAGRLSLSWPDNSGQGEALATDVAMPLAYNAARGEAVYSLSAGARSSGSSALDIPASWSGERLEVYLAFASADGRRVSTSSYLGQHTAV